MTTTRAMPSSSPWLPGTSGPEQRFDRVAATALRRRPRERGPLNGLVEGASPSRLVESRLDERLTWSVSPATR
jgi:hypothetical protein